MEIEYRAAAPQDAEALTDLMLQAGGDTLQFVLDGLAPGVSAWALYAHMVCSTESECSYRHCLVAEVGAAVVGMANAFPTARLRDEPHAFALSQREIHIRQRTEVQDWGSYCLNNIAVAPLFQGQGIAARLIDLVGEKARSEGFDRLTLHVWGDNARAAASTGGKASRRSGGLPLAGILPCRMWAGACSCSSPWRQAVNRRQVLPFRLSLLCPGVATTA